MVGVGHVERLDLELGVIERDVLGGGVGIALHPRDEGEGLDLWLPREDELDPSLAVCHALSDEGVAVIHVNGGALNGAVEVGDLDPSVEVPEVVRELVRGVGRIRIDALDDEGVGCHEDLLHIGILKAILRRQDVVVAGAVGGPGEHAEAVGVGVVHHWAVWGARPYLHVGLRDRLLAVQALDHEHVLVVDHEHLRTLYDELVEVHVDIEWIGVQEERVVRPGDEVDLRPVQVLGRYPLKDLHVEIIIAIVIRARGEREQEVVAGVVHVDGHGNVGRDVGAVHGADEPDIILGGIGARVGLARAGDC